MRARHWSKRRGGRRHSVFGVNILSWIVVGFLAAVIAGAVTGRPAEGCITKIAVGVIGALIGGALANAADLKGLDGFGLRSVLIAALGASVFLFVLGAIEGGRSRTAIGRRRPRSGPGRRSLP
jgi:uncharacterized membrane protein YeaQ/YmgE (transglycosylase-associated protein family)